MKCSKFRDAKEEGFAEDAVEFGESGDGKANLGLVALVGGEEE
jgi:hypothetical protein